MKLIDVPVPLDAALPTYPDNLPFSLEPMKRVARGDRSNASTLHMSAHGGTHVEAPRHFFDDRPGTDALPLKMLSGCTRVLAGVDPGIYEMNCLPPRMVGADGTPARAMLRRN